MLSGRQLSSPVTQAGELLATVLEQDLTETDDGRFLIARRVAPDRVISTVDPQARHGRKSSAHGFDGYKGHVGIDPDSEIITSTTVTAGNLPDPAADRAAGGDEDAWSEALAVYGDAAYGAGELLQVLDAAGATVRCKVQPAVAPAGRFAKDLFSIDLARRTVRCPAGVTATLQPAGSASAMAYFGAACASCPLAPQCTTAKGGRTISIGPHEEHLARARTAQQDPAWRQDYRATRPKVERKIGHLMRRWHGGRRARVRGLDKITADLSLLAAAVNLARLAVIKLVNTGPGSTAIATA